MRPVVAALLLVALGGAARADEQPVAIAQAPGHEAVENNCMACHSLDYPRTNAKFLDRKGWQAEIDKMVKVYGAEIAPADIATIVDYLTKNYGAGE